MNIISWIILLAVAGAAAAAIRHIIKNRSLSECSGCCENCANKCGKMHE